MGCQIVLDLLSHFTRCGGERRYRRSRVLQRCHQRRRTCPSTAGAIDWSLTYNTIDLEAGRKFAVGESAWIRPSLGIKTAIIQQRIQLGLANPGLGISAEEDVTHDFWGIGPSFGISGAWNLPRCRNLSLTGSFSADFLFGQWNVNDAYTRTDNQLPVGVYGAFVTSMKDSCLGVPVLRYFLGLQWVHEGRVTITARAGYELQWWANQQRVLAFQQLPMHGDLTLDGSYMRRFCWLLVCCLLLTSPRAFALEFFGDVLYWQATEPVDWTMNTNRSSTDQWVAFKTLDYHFSPGFRVGVGVGLESDWGVKLSYTRFYTDTEDTAAGNVTPVFLGNRLALLSAGPALFRQWKRPVRDRLQCPGSGFRQVVLSHRVAAIAARARLKRRLDQSDL